MNPGQRPIALEPTTPRSRVASVLLIGLLVPVVLISVLSFHRKVTDFQPIGLTLEPVTEGWMVSSAYQLSSLAAGDILVLIDTELFSTKKEAEDLLAGALAVNVSFLRDGELQEGIHRRPGLRIDFPYLVLALIGVAYLLIGLYTLLRGVNGQVALFVLWCACSALLYLVSPRMPPADGLDLLIYLVDESCRSFLPPLTLHFFLIFPRRLRVGPAGSTLKRRYLPLLYLPATALLAIEVDLALNLKRLIPVPTTPLVNLLDRVDLLLLVAFSLTAVVALIAQGRHSAGWEERRQILWIAAGIAAGYIPFLGLYVAPLNLEIPTPELIQVIAVLPLALVPLGFAWALLRYRLWDVAVILRNSATYTLTLLLGGVGFSLLSLLIRNQIPTNMEWTRNLTTIAGGLLVAGLLVPTRQSIGATLERFQYRGGFARRRALADLGEELLHERNLEQLCANLTRQLEDTMGLERCNLFLLQDDEFHPVTPESLTTNFFLPQEAIGPRFWELDWIRIEQQSLPTLDPDIEDELFGFGYRTAFPLRVRDRPVGILATGYKTGHTPLTSADSDLVRQILNHAALAIENAQLLEQMQQRLQQVLELKHFNEEIIESSPAGIAVLDDQDRIVVSNFAFAELVKSGNKELRRLPIGDVLPIELPEAEAGLLETTLPDGRGRDRHVQMSLASLHSAKDQGTRVLVINDVTELTQMERTLQEKERLAALGVMAAGVAHEVNTPLTGISSYAQMLLQDTPKTDPRYEMLQKVERQTFRASRIVGNLLDLSRSSGPILGTVELRSLFNESTDQLRARLEQHEVDVRISSDWPQDLAITGDEGELLQVINNLLINAAEAISSSRPTILPDGEPETATTEKHEHATIDIEVHDRGTVVEISVLDRGPGLSPENLPRIFRPFFSTKKDSGGTGLGLSISYEIVRRHGGELRVRNRKGGGCKFSIILPHTQNDSGGLSESKRSTPSVSP